jgi:uncharacterized protein
MYSDLILRFIGFLLPLVLIGTTIIAFDFFSKQFGPKKGYLFGFLFYWLFWCLTIPLLFMNSAEIESLFSFNASLFNKSKLLNISCLVAPLILAYCYAFPKAVNSATFKIVVLSLLLALVNATMEELLWRGLYLKLFGSDKWIYVFYSSYGFAIWHFAPQHIFPNKAPGGQISFVAVAFVVGVLFSLVSYNTNSILLVSISHILFDFSGLGAMIYSRSPIGLPVLNDNRLHWQNN